MTQFDPRIQVQVTRTRRAWLDVTISPFELQSALALRAGSVKSWFKLPAPDTYGCELLLQMLLDDADGNRVAMAEIVVEQIYLVHGFDAAGLKDVLEQQLPAIAMPYARAGIAALMQSSAYQNVLLPVVLPGADAAATEVDARTRKPVEATQPPVPAENVEVAL